MSLFTCNGTHRPSNTETSSDFTSDSAIPDFSVTAVMHFSSHFTDSTDCGTATASTIGDPETGDEESTVDVVVLSSVVDEGDDIESDGDESDG